MAAKRRNLARRKGTRKKVVAKKTTWQERALRIGRAQANAVVADRARARARRATAVRKHLRVASRAGRAVRAAAPGSSGVVVAEGDSWFDYPFFDVLKILDDDYGYEIETVAHRGDAVEMMAYERGQLDDFARRIEKLLRHGTPPKAILLSGGGNDVAGEEFGMLINHRSSPSGGLNRGVLDGVLEGRIQPAYVTILSSVTHLCRSYLPDETIPILVHGYDYPVPDGRGFLGGFGPLPGPWLEPGFREKGYDDLGERIAIAKQMMDRFNAMLAGVAALPEFAHVHYVDLRNTLSTSPSSYKSWWGNELHPTQKGFAAVTKRFADVLAKV